jgi:hypothetical protein
MIKVSDSLLNRKVVRILLSGKDLGPCLGVCWTWFYPNPWSKTARLISQAEELDKNLIFLTDFVEVVEYQLRYDPVDLGDLYDIGNIFQSVKPSIEDNMARDLPQQIQIPDWPCGR